MSPTKDSAAAHTALIRGAIAARDTRNAATRESGREHARLILRRSGQSALEEYAARILANTNRPGPFSLGLLDVAKGILATTTTTEGN